MSKDPAFLFYSSDFLTGTMLMSNEQVGKYIRLLCLQHQKNILTEKDMLKICSTYDEDIWNKFVKTDEGYYNVRLKEENEKRLKYTESRRNNRKKKDSEKDMLNICNSYDEHMENENENVNSNIVLLNKKSKKEKEPTIFDDFLEKNCPTVLKLKTQLTADQAQKLADEFGMKECEEIFEAMENWIPLSKKSKSVYLTAKKWLTNRKTANSNGKSKRTFTEAAMDWLNQTS